MTREQAMALLFDVTFATPGAKPPSDVRAAWAARVRQCHADTSGDGTSNAAMLEKLTKARDLLLTVGPEPCTSCKGLGKVRRRFGSVDCGACKGTGDKQ